MRSFGLKGIESCPYSPVGCTLTSSKTGQHLYSLFAKRKENAVIPFESTKKGKHPTGVLFFFVLLPGDRTGAGVNDVPGARQSRDLACAAAQVDPLQVHLKVLTRTLV